MSEELPQISSDGLDIGRQRIYPRDCFRVAESTDLFPVTAVEHQPTRGLVVETPDETFWSEREVIDHLADGEVIHWRHLATETATCSADLAPDDQQFAVYMFATDAGGPPPLEVMTGVTLVDTETSPSPCHVTEWVSTPRIGFTAQDFEHLPDWLQQDPDLVQPISRLLWNATSTARERNFPSVLSEQDVFRPQR